ncbi:MAG: hypothetical protein CMP94_00455 [Gammaproteobacteria bacterium]|nr:hypothetical protein [Gammaproteobacteria bacterium]
MISRLQHSFGERRWLSSLLLLAFLCHQSINLSHDHQHFHHGSQHSFAEHSHGTPADAEPPCGPCTASEHTPAAGFADIQFAMQGFTNSVESAGPRPAWVNVDEQYLPRAPPHNQQTI